MQLQESEETLLSSTSHGKMGTGSVWQSLVLLVWFGC